MAKLAIMLQTEVRSAWKATHIEINPRLSTSVPASKIPAYLPVSSANRFVSKKRVWTAKMPPIMTIPCTA